MSQSALRSVVPAVVLLLVMAATRIHHFAAIPDASWAVFFAGGFYLARQTRWAFPLFILVAVLADWWVIQGTGASFWTHYCVSPAYWFLLPAYLSLWLGGLWLQRRKPGLRWASLGQLATALLVSASLCYLLSNGSFYWISDSVAQPSLGGWLANLGHWYLPFMKVTALYVACAAGLHTIGLGLTTRPALPESRSASH